MLSQVTLKGILQFSHTYIPINLKVIYFRNLHRVFDWQLGTVHANSDHKNPSAFPPTEQASSKSGKQKLPFNWKKPLAETGSVPRGKLSQQKVISTRK